MAEAAAHNHSTQDLADNQEKSLAAEAALGVVPLVEAAVEDVAGEEADQEAERVLGHLDLGLP